LCSLVCRMSTDGVRMKIKKEELFSIPNLLSYFRILLIPCFVYLYLSATKESEFIAAAMILIISGLTDLLDGKIARKFNMITEMGKALDPLADKLTQAAVAICLTFEIKYFFIIVIIMVIKESFMLFANIISMKLYKRKLGGAEWFGKVTTAIVYLVMFLLIIMPNMEQQNQTWITLGLGIILVSTGVLYIPVFRKLFKDEYEYVHPKFLK